MKKVSKYFLWPQVCVEKKYVGIDNGVVHISETSSVDKQRLEYDISHGI